jgi:hypothetical protein
MNGSVQPCGLATKVAGDTLMRAVRGRFAWALKPSTKALDCGFRAALTGD